MKNTLDSGNLEFIITEKTGTNWSRGTYLHRVLMGSFISWLSPEFEARCSLLVACLENFHNTGNLDSLLPISLNINKAVIGEVERICRSPIFHKKKIITIKYTEEEEDKVDSTVVDNEGVVYRMQSPDGYYYIGKTTIGIIARFQSHRSASRRLSGQPVYHHFNQVGWDNVTIAVIESVSLSDLDRREIELISQRIGDTKMLNVQHAHGFHGILGHIVIIPEEKKRNEILSEEGEEWSSLGWKLCGILLYKN